MRIEELLEELSEEQATEDELTPRAALAMAKQSAADTGSEVVTTIGAMPLTQQHDVSKTIDLDKRMRNPGLGCTRAVQ